MLPLGYLITFTTYGTWLHGREEGSVDRQHNRLGEAYLSPNFATEQARLRQMRDSAFVLDGPRRKIVLATIVEVCQHRQWRLWAAHVRSNHVHLVVTSTETPEKIMADLKAWASRRLQAAFQESRQRKRWTQHGSARWLKNEDSFQRAIAYVRDEQGDRLSYYSCLDEPEASATDIGNAETQDTNVRR